MAFSERWEERGKKTKNTAQEQAQERPAHVGLGLRLTPGPGAPFEGATVPNDEAEDRQSGGGGRGHRRLLRITQRW